MNPPPKASTLSVELKVKNRASLVRCGDSAGRKLVLDIVEEALGAVDSYHGVRSLLSLEGDILRVGNRTWNLSEKRNLYLVGAGKACNAMAMAVDHVLGDRLTRGIAIVKIAEESDHYGHTEVHVGGHPIPNLEGHLAAGRVLDLVDHMGPKDLVIAVMSGGSSALMNVPVEGISVEEEAETTRVLLTSGADIYAINAVRRHISQTNGGRLAERIAAAGAELIGINIRDAVSVSPHLDPAEPDLTFDGTPIGSDSTTIADARATIRDFDLSGRIPRSVVDYLESASLAAETPKAFPSNTYFTINTLPDLSAAAAEASNRRGIDTHVLTTFLEGESRDAGTFMASLAREIQSTGRPFKAPCVVISGGETVTRISPGTAVAGHGGPSHELALSFALAAAKVPGACMYAMDSEGTDGTSPAAGGLTDSTSVARARSANIDFRQLLREHASYEALAAIGDSVVTGNTGTNLCDLNVLFVPSMEQEGHSL